MPITNFAPRFQSYIIFKLLLITILAVTCNAPLVHHDCYRRRCEPSCGALSDENACPKLTHVCFPGCYCPPGYVRNKYRECVLPTSCGDCECNVLPHLEYVTYDERNFTINGNCVYVMSRDILDKKNKDHKFQVRFIAFLFLICTR